MDIKAEVSDYWYITKYQVWKWLGLHLGIDTGYMQEQLGTAWEDCREADSELCQAKLEIDSLQRQLRLAWSDYEESDQKYLSLLIERDNLLDKIEVLELDKQELTAPDAGSSRANRKKLTKQEVHTIRELSRSGLSNREIADTFDINPATVSRIVRGLYHRK